jgi:hypothetical protein
LSTVLTVAPAGVLGNDVDPEGAALTATLVSAPTNGTVTLNPNGSFTYGPRVGFSGADSFTYRAGDGAATSNTATVRLTVGSTPPPSSAAGRVTGKGTIAFSAGTGTFQINVVIRNGRAGGRVTYAERKGRERRALRSTSITSLVISGSRARILAQGSLSGTGAVSFVLDVEDAPRGQRDRVKLELSTGETVGPQALVRGNITIRAR